MGVTGSGVFFAQERRNTCAVAALRSVLASQFGVSIREDVLRFAGDTASAPIVSSGTTTGDLRRMLEVANRAANTGPRWRLLVRRHGVVADLAREVRAGRYPLASVERETADGLELHMVVVCGYAAGRVRVFDPASGRTRWCGSGAFRREWLDSSGLTWYAVVKGG